MDTCDVVVVGAGIVGLAVAREIIRRRPADSVTVLEKETEVAQHQTGHNSGVVHGGIYYEPGSLKARLCVDGSRLMYEYCEDHGIAYEKCGKLIVAVRHDELGRLEELHRRGLANHVPGLRRINGAEIPDVEPQARGVAALHAPNTGIVDYGQVARKMSADLRAAGVRVELGTEVTGFVREPGGTVVEHSRGAVRGSSVVVCAGLWADRLARRAGAEDDPRIVPFRGAYLRLAETGQAVVRGMVYPVPDPQLPFLGVHVTRHIDGSVDLGPTAMLALARDGYGIGRLTAKDAREALLWPGTWRMMRRFWRAGAREVRMAASRQALVAAAAEYVPAVADLPLEPVVHAGVRAQALGRDGRLVDDFLISRVGGVHVVRNAPSPAATSSLALAREVVDRIQSEAP